MFLGAAAAALLAATALAQDAAMPSAADAATIAGPDGSRYGTTSHGGVFGLGSVYRLAPDGTTTTLHDFGSAADDGATPLDRLVYDARTGRFYGTTAAGGANACGARQAGCGTVFAISPGGRFRTLHVFSGAEEGDTPDGALVQTSDGDFYGRTRHGGAFDTGAIFRMRPNGALTVLCPFGIAAEEVWPASGS